MLSNKPNQLIAINTNEKGEQVVSGRELHSFLEIGSKYSTWFPRMTEFGLVENVDYTTVWNEPKTGFVVVSDGNAQRMVKLGYEINHHLTLDTAKQISMIQKSEKGTQARLYFIESEKALVKVAQELADMPYELQMMIKIHREQKQLKEEMAATTQLVENHVERMDKMVDVMATKTEGNWRKEMDNMVKALCKHTGNYQETRRSLYKQLETEGSCILSRRLENLQSRLLMQGVAKSEVDKKNKMDVIESDKRLRTLFETIVRRAYIKFV